jgi:hypothetical protein
MGIEGTNYPELGTTSILCLLFLETYEAQSTLRTNSQIHDTTEKMQLGLEITHLGGHCFRDGEHRIF